MNVVLILGMFPASCIRHRHLLHSQAMGLADGNMTIVALILSRPVPAQASYVMKVYGHHSDLNGRCDALDERTRFRCSTRSSSQICGHKSSINYISLGSVSTSSWLR